MSDIDWSNLNTMWVDSDKEKKVDGGQSKENKHPKLLWMLDIDEGPQAGKRVFKGNVLINKKNMEYLIKDLHTCNYGELPEHLSNLERAKLQDTKVAIAVKTGDSGHQDVYINRVVNTDATSVSRLNTYSDDDIPF